MSNQAVTWAYAQDVKPAGAKFVLVTLANFADADGHCYPSQRRLAEDSGLSERAVRDHLTALEARDFIRRSARRRKDGSRTSDAFDLSMGRTNREISPVAATGKSRRTNRQISPNQPADFAGHEPSVEPPEEPITKSPIGDLGAAGRAVAKPPDLKSEIFGTCLHWLARQCGKPKDRLRPMVGRWCRDHGDGRVLETMTQAARAGPVEPVAWIEQVLKEGRDGRRQHKFGDLTAGQAAVAGITGHGP
jgi:hypothetical protein